MRRVRGLWFRSQMCIRDRDKEGTPRLLVKKEHKYSAEKTAGRGRKEGAA